jgi:hypothetical protein
MHQLQNVRISFMASCKQARFCERFPSHANRVSFLPLVSPVKLLAFLARAKPVLPHLVPGAAGIAPLLMAIADRPSNHQPTNILA